MATEHLTAQELRDVLDYDKDTGIFRWKKRLSIRVSVGAIAGSRSKTGYVVTRIRGRDHYMHRLAWLHFYGEWPRHEVDHIDGCRSNNAIANLRDVPHHTNTQNLRRPKPNSVTGVLGVSADGSKWRASICVDGRKIHLGHFASKELAHAAYLGAKRVAHAGCTI